MKQDEMDRLQGIIDQLKELKHIADSLEQLVRIFTPVIAIPELSEEEREKFIKRMIEAKTVYTTTHSMSIDDIITPISEYEPYVKLTNSHWNKIQRKLKVLELLKNFNFKFSDLGNNDISAISDTEVLYTKEEYELLKEELEYEPV